jgi:protease I
MADILQGKRIAFLTANEGVEQVELTEPWKAVSNAGATPVLIAPKPGRVQAFNHLDKAATFPVDEQVDKADVRAFDALVLPGGVANPDQLRMVPAAVHFVRTFEETGRPIAAICHAPWMLIDAGIAAGRTLTSWPSLRTDIMNAGGEWIDEEVVVDTHGASTLVTSRAPADLPRFCEQLVQTFAQARTSV